MAELIKPSSIESSIDRPKILSGQLTSSNSITGSVSRAPTTVPIYQGPYEIDPTFEDQSFNTDQRMMNRDLVVRAAPGALPAGGEYGDIIIKRSSADYDAEWVAPANSAEQDNTRPITAAAVYTEIGNINALLATI